MVISALWNTSELGQFSVNSPHHKGPSVLGLVGELAPSYQSILGIRDVTAGRLLNATLQHSAVVIHSASSVPGLVVHSSRWEITFRVWTGEFSLSLSRGLTELAEVTCCLGLVLGDMRLHVVG